MNQCLYCTRPGTLRVKEGESPEVKENIYVCAACWRLLSNPATALPLIRGHLSLTEGRNIPEKEFKRLMDKYMEFLTTLKPTN